MLYVSQKLINFFGVGFTVEISKVFELKILPAELDRDGEPKTRHSKQLSLTQAAPSQ
jgi:hypothetical protein